MRVVTAKDCGELSHSTRAIYVSSMFKEYCKDGTAAMGINHLWLWDPTIFAIGDSEMGKWY